ncbi:hypothetical protein Tco_0536123 [Tanacetum coccineum]
MHGPLQSNLKLAFRVLRQNVQPQQDMVLQFFLVVVLSHGKAKNNLCWLSPQLRLSTEKCLMYKKYGGLILKILGSSGFKVDQVFISQIQKVWRVDFEDSWKFRVQS